MPFRFWFTFGLLSSRLSGGPLSFVPWVFSFFVVSFRVVCWACVFRPVICFGLLCLSLCVGCCLVCVRSLWCCGFVLAFGCCWFLFPSSVALRVFALLCGLLRFGPFSPGFVPLSCPPLGWSFGAFWSSQCTAGPPGIWLFLRRPECHACGTVWSVVTAWLLSSLLFMATKASACVGSALYTMLRVSFRCSSFLRWGIHPWVIQNPLGHR